MVSEKGSDVILIFAPLYIRYLFSLASFKLFLYLGLFVINTVCLGVAFLFFLLDIL